MSAISKHARRRVRRLNERRITRPVNRAIRRHLRARDVHGAVDLIRARVELVPPSGRGIPNSLALSRFERCVLEQIATHEVLFGDPLRTHVLAEAVDDLTEAELHAAFVDDDPEPVVYAPSPALQGEPEVDPEYWADERPQGLRGLLARVRSWFTRGEMELSS